MNFLNVYLQVLQQEAGHEHLATQVVAARAGAQTPEEAIELETLAHEDGLGRLLEQVLEVALVRVSGEAVHGAVGGGVKGSGLQRRVGGGRRQLRAADQVLEASLGHNPA